MEITGGCFCGALRYEAVVNPQLLGICHCRDCQLFSGSAFRTAGPVLPADFRFTHGKPKLFRKVADTGNARDAAFCEICGSHICTLPVDPGADGAFVSLRWATADESDQIKPSVEIFCDSRASWLSEVEVVENTMRFPRMPS